MTQHGRERVQEEAGELVQGVKDQGVVPEYDGDAQRPHGQRVIHLEPEQLVRVEQGLDHAGQVDDVAEVQHEEVVLDRLVHEEAGDEEEEHEVPVERRKPVGMSAEEKEKKMKKGN